MTKSSKIEEGPSTPYSASRAQTAKVFWSGRSQAVRLPKEFRFETREVWIYREGDRVVLEARTVPVDEKGWPEDFLGLFGKLDESFDLGDRGAPAERDDLFGDL